MLNPNKPVVAASTHYARCCVNALVEGRTSDMTIALHDFGAVGFNEGVALIREFFDVLFLATTPRERMRVRLFRFKLARRWAEFTRDLETARAARRI
jgi:hypothetical protein